MEERRVRVNSSKRSTVPAEKLKNVIHVLLWVLAISLYMAFNYIPAVGIAMLLLLCGSAALSGRGTMKHEWIASGIMAICLVIGMLALQYSIRMLLATAIAACALFMVVMDTKAKTGRRSKAFIAFGVVGYILSGAVFAFLLVNAINPDPLMKLMQNGAADYPTNVVETFEERDGVSHYYDVTYDSQYPNNTYTVHVVPNSKGVFFYMHGGGLVIGDKEGAEQNVYLNAMMDAGYSTVTVDYVLAPQNPFPQSVCEVNDALAHFIRHVDDYGLTADRIIVGGDSAGGMLSGLVAVINTNPDYAKELGVTPAVEGTDVTLKGYVSVSGLVDVPRFSNSGMFVIDWIFDTMARSSFQKADYSDTYEAHLGSVLEHVTADFPPTYASDGNLGSFGAQNKDLVARLQELGVPVNFNFPGRDTATLLHIWDLNTNSELGAANFARTIAFMDEYMK